MAIQKISDEQFIAEREAGKTLRQISQEYGMNIRTVEQRSSNLAKKGHGHGNKAVAKYVPDGFAVKGTSTMIDAEGNEKIRWVKTSIDNERLEVLMEQAREAFCSELPKADVVIHSGNEVNSELMTLYPIFDIHIGMMAHRHESGENYDTNTAEKLMGSYFDHAISVSPASEKAVILVGGDFLHSDGLEAVTPASGHCLDQDSRYAKLVYVAIRSIRGAVGKMLKKHKNVEIQIIEGNHDQSGMIWLRAAMAAFYEDESRVFVDTSPAIMHKTRFGSTLLGYTHGHTMKKAEGRLAAMATDYRKDFGECEFVYCHSGHFHHATVTECTLGIDEVHPALASKDAYAARGGWRSYRQAAAIIYHKNFGEVGRHIYRPGM